MKLHRRDEPVIADFKFKRKFVVELQLPAFSCNNIYVSRLIISVPNKVCFLYVFFKVANKILYPARSVVINQFYQKKFPPPLNPRDLA